MLSSLSEATRQALALRPRALQAGETLVQEDSEADFVCFPLNCVLAVFARDQSGRTLQTGMVGREGAVGLVEALGTGVASWTVHAQVAGDALVAPAAEVRRAARADPAFAEAAWLSAQAQLVQAREFTLCHAHHEAEGRVSRWLLELHDKSEQPILRLNQDYLAEMLGLQRTTVSTAAARLQAAKLVRYARGRVAIVDVEGLARRACRCQRKLFVEQPEARARKEQPAEVVALAV